jgi:hypothetical protein
MTREQMQELHTAVQDVLYLMRNHEREISDLHLGTVELSTTFIHLEELEDNLGYVLRK